MPCRYWPSLQKLLVTIVSTIREIGNFSVLLFLFMYIYALIGMQMFGNRFRFDSDGFPVDMTQPAAHIPRANFDTILWSMVTIFQVRPCTNIVTLLSLESWACASRAHPTLACLLSRIRRSSPARTGRTS